MFSTWMPTGWLLYLQYLKFVQEHFWVWTHFHSLCLEYTLPFQSMNSVNLFSYSRELFSLHLLLFFIWMCWVLVVACKLLVEASGIQFPDQGSDPGPLHWKCRVLPTVPPGKSLCVLLLIITSSQFVVAPS